MNEQEIRRELRTLRRELAARQLALESPGHTVHQEELDALDAVRARMESLRRTLGQAWTPTVKEQKMQAFQTALAELVRVDFSLCRFIGGWQSVCVEQTAKGAVRRTEGLRPEDTDERPVCWADFLARLQALHMEEWRRRYVPERFGEVVMDGTQWTLQLSFGDGRRAVRFRGDNDFPYNFSQLLTALGLHEEDEEMNEVDELLQDIGDEADGVYQTEGVYFAIRDGQIYEISDDAGCAPRGGWFPTLVRGLPEEQEAYLARLEEELGLDADVLPEFWEEWDQPTLDEVLDSFDEDEDAEKIQLCRELAQRLEREEAPFADVPSLLLALPRRGLDGDTIYYPWEGEYIDLRENILDTGEPRGEYDSLDDDDWAELLENLEEYRVIVGDPGVTHEVDFVVTVCLGRGDGGDEAVTLEVSDLEYQWLKQCARLDWELSECDALEDLRRRLAEEVTPWDEEEEDLYQIIVYPPHEIYEAVE